MDYQATQADPREEEEEETPRSKKVKQEDIVRDFSRVIGHDMTMEDFIDKWPTKSTFTQGSYRVALVVGALWEEYKDRLVASNRDPQKKANLNVQAELAHILKYYVELKIEYGETPYDEEYWADGCY